MEIATRGPLVRIGALAVLTLVVGCASPASAQETTPGSKPPARLWAYVDVGGPGILGSANIEYQPLRALSLRVGAAALPFCLFSDCELVALFPVSAQTFLGGERYHLELGLGAVLTTFSDEANWWLVTVGYRFARPEGGVLFRAHLNLLARTTDLSDVLPVPGVSFGYGW